MTTLEGSWSYGYDLDGRLASVSGPGGRSIQYAYDAAGNRTSVVDNATTTEYASNLMDQYTAVGATTQGIYPGVTGHTYRFYSIAMDGVGLREAPPPAPDVETTAGEGGGAIYLPLVMR
jgi:YD repeat-containing protein